MTNSSAKRTEKSIDRVIDKILKAKEAGDYRRISELKDLLVALVHKWEARHNDTIDNNAVLHKIISNKFYLLS